MSVYVNDLTPCPLHANWPQDAYCHLIADDLAQLDAIAISIGLTTKSLLHGYAPCYRLTRKLRLLTLNAGAIPVDPQQYVNVIRRYRQNLNSDRQMTNDHRDSG